MTVDHDCRLFGIRHSTWCVLANLTYLAALMAVACCALTYAFSLIWWQFVVAVVVLFFPLGYFVEHHAHGCHLANYLFDITRTPRPR